MLRTWTGRLLLVALVVMSTASAVWPQTSPDPQSLVGRWSGSWIDTKEERSSGRYYLTVERVDGEKVVGKREAIGWTPAEAKIGNGRLSGNRLTFGKTELTIDGEQMRGTAPNVRITLTKEK
jgi:hypothetical protein